MITKAHASPRMGRFSNINAEIEHGAIDGGRADTSQRDIDCADHDMGVSACIATDRKLAEPAGDFRINSYAVDTDLKISDGALITPVEDLKEVSTRTTIEFVLPSSPN